MSHAAPFPKRFRQKYSRSKDGCFTCRARRKRCGFQWPICEACKRSSLPCRWPDRDAVPLLETASTKAFRAATVYSTSTNSASRLVPCSISCHSWATSFSSTSLHLFQHYIERTEAILSTKTLESNAFRTLLSYATSDDLLMHCILAVSGVHFNAYDDVPAESKQTTIQHYISAVSSLRTAIGPASERCSREEWLRLGGALILMAHAEAMSGDTTGTIFLHLRALREVVAKLRQTNEAYSTSAARDVEGLVYETYAYLAIVSNITPYGAMKTRQIPLDSFILDLDYLHRYPTFGTFFGCGQVVFEQILPVATLTRNMLRNSESPDGISFETTHEYQTLLQHIESLHLAADGDGFEAEFEEGRKAVCELYRHALLAWLKSAFLNVAVQREDSVRAEIQFHVDAAYPHFLPAIRSPYCSILLWPSIILGSCVVLRDEMDRFNELLLLASEKLRLDQITAAAGLLTAVWDSPDRTYGPLGLLRVMQEQGTNLCIA